MNRPFIYTNMAMTADGKITSSARDYPRFTSRFDRRNMDRLRAEADALMVGAGTIRADDPPLHVRDESMQRLRESLGKPPGLDRIVVSASGRIPAESRFFLDDHGCRRVIATVDDLDRDRLAELESRAELIRVGRRRVDLNRLLQRLRDDGIERLLVEGGAALNGELLDLGLIDEFHVTVAPALLGGRDAPTPVGGPGLAMARQVRLRLVDLHRESDELFCRYAVVR